MNREHAAVRNDHYPAATADSRHENAREVVVVAVDPSSAGRAAVTWAAEYARQRAAKAVVVEMIPRMWLLSALQVDTDALRAQSHENIVRRICAPLREAQVAHEIVHYDESGTRAVLDAVERYDASLVVVGHEHQGAVGDHVPGLAAHRLLLHANVPVVFVPTRT